MTFPWLEDASQQLDRCLFGPRRIHACLLAGPRKLGKVELAKRKAAALLCLKPVNSADGWQACGTCKSCLLVAGGAHPDFQMLTFEFKPKPNENELRTELVIDQVRELTAALSLSNILSPCKVALIHPAETLNRMAANALLKTLEEPPGSAVILLVANESSRLPATVRSRCQYIEARIPEQGMARDWLVETTGMDAKSANAALSAAAGSPVAAAALYTNGALRQFQGLERLLAQVRTRESAIGEALAVLSEPDADQVWTWISLVAAQRLRDSLGNACQDQSDLGISSTDSFSTREAAAVARLQRLADRNRRLMSTPVKKDLLLRDWLIQWSRLSSA